MNPEAEHLSEARTHLTPRQEHHIKSRVPCLAHQLRQLEKLKQQPEDLSGIAANGAE